MHGNAFVDITTNPCDGNITDIWVRSGSLVDAIQVQYNHSDNGKMLSPKRGGGGGIMTHIPVNHGEKIFGIMGDIYVSADDNNNKVITNIRILKLTSEKTSELYGPFGSRKGASDFVVIGDIKSIFGYSDHYLRAIGFYYEAFGACGNPFLC